MTAIDGAELDALVQYWRGANYLTVAQIYLQDNPLLREPLARRAHQAAPARALGHVARAEPRLRPAQPADPARRGADVLYVAGPGHGGPALVANVYLEGTYSEIYPEVTADEAGLLRLVRQFSTPGGIPSHVERPDPGLDPRGRRARLRARARVRRRLRQPRPARRLRRRRRRGRDGAARGLVEGRPLPQPGPRRRRAADPAPERLQDLRARPCSAGAERRGDRRAARAPRLRAAVVAGDDPRQVHRGVRRDARRLPRARSARSRRTRARTAIARERPRLAGDRAAHAEGLDRPRGGRRRAGRGHLPRPPGAALRRARESRRTWRCSRTGCAATRRRSASTSAGGSSPSCAALAPEGDNGWARRRTPTAAGCCVRSTCRDRRLRDRRRAPGRGACRVDPPARRDAARHLPPEPDELPALLPRRDELQPARRRVRGREPLPDRADPRRRTTTCPPTAG